MPHLALTASPALSPSHSCNEDDAMQPLLLGIESDINRDLSPSPSCNSDTVTDLATSAMQPLQFDADADDAVDVGIGGTGCGGGDSGGEALQPSAPLLLPPSPSAPLLLPPSPSAGQHNNSLLNDAKEGQHNLAAAARANVTLTVAASGSVGGQHNATAHELVLSRVRSQSRAIPLPPSPGSMLNNSNNSLGAPPAVPLLESSSAASSSVQPAHHRHHPQQQQHREGTSGLLLFPHSRLTTVGLALLVPVSIIGHALQHSWYCGRAAPWLPGATLVLLLSCGAWLLLTVTVATAAAHGGANGSVERFSSCANLAFLLEASAGAASVLLCASGLLCDGDVTTVLPVHVQVMVDVLSSHAIVIDIFSSQAVLIALSCEAALSWLWFTITWSASLRLLTDCSEPVR